MDAKKPLPQVGDRIRQDYGQENINTWKHAGVVLAVLDGGNLLTVLSPTKPRSASQLSKTCAVVLVARRASGQFLTWPRLLT